MRLAALIVAFFLPASAVGAAREDQWIYRELEGAGMARYPTAIFLDWMYTGVIFRVQCDRRTGDLVFEYFADGGVKLMAEESMELILGEAFLPMRTTVADGRLEGRLAARGVVGGWNAETEVAIIAPNEMGEPWYAGSAGPLKAVAQDCVRRNP